MNSPEDDNLSIDNEEKDDEFQEKLDFEESELLDDNTVSPQKNDSATASPVANDNGSPAAVSGEEEAKPKEKTIKLISVRNSGEDGELVNDEDSDDDLEEGELKDEDDPVSQSLDVLVRWNEQKSIPCKFYSNGQCTWGDQCRFMHSDTARNSNSSSQPKPPIRSNLSTKYYQPYNSKYGGSDNRGEPDPRYDDHHADGYNYNGSRGGYSSSRDKPYDNRQYNTYDKDYERKRRLALESAPWNDEYRASDYPHKTQSSNPVTKDSSFHNHSNSSSFSDFSSEKSFNQSPKEKKRRIDKDDRQTTGREAASGHRNSKEKRRSEPREDYDDLHSLSSIFSDSDTSLNNDRDKLNRKHSKEPRPRSPPPAASRKRSRSKEQHRAAREESEQHGRPEQTYQQHKQSSSYSRAKTAASSQHNEKKPIKMTFMRKQSSLKKGDEFESGGEASDQNDEFSLYGNSKDEIITKSASSTPSKTAAASTPASREELLKRLKEIDEAIARKRSKV